MPSTFKNASLNPINVGLDVLYTVPAATNAVAMSAIGTSINGQSQSAHIGVVKNGTDTINWLASNISVPNGSSVNLLAGKVSLDVGDKLVANNTNAGISYRIRSDGTHCFTGEPSLLLSDPTGSVIVAVCPTGIFTSTDGGLTSTQTRVEVLDSLCGIYFSGAFHIYLSGSLRKSTDGITWSVISAPNAPTFACSIFGNIITVAGSIYGKSSDRQMVVSTDGSTWSQYGSLTPVASNSLCWTGVNWVVGNTPGNGLAYYSTNAADWTSTSIGGGTNGTNTAGLASNGAGLVVAIVYQGGNFYAYLSINHGVTFTYQSGAFFQNGSGLFFAGGSFVGWQNGFSLYISQSGVTGSWLSVPDLFAASYSYPITLAGSYYMMARAKTFDLALTRRGGLTVTASVVEVS